jgi:hypothetical protein
MEGARVGGYGPSRGAKLGREEKYIKRPCTLPDPEFHLCTSEFPSSRKFPYTFITPPRFDIPFLKNSGAGKTDVESSIEIDSLIE